MESNSSRRSDRVSVQLSIQVLGSDATGRDFFEEGRTSVVTRHGAKIHIARKLAPQQELTIRCLETGREGVGRVVGQIEAGPKEFTYGILLIDPEVNLWGIEFPEGAQSEEAFGRIVMECLACHTKEVAYLDEFELEVLEANEALSRYCKRCADASVWKKSFGEVPPPQAELPRPIPAVEEKQRRREPRRELRVGACIRSLEFGDDMVTTRNVSRGGVCFESQSRYEEGWKVEVAVPYSKGGGNIFVPGRIVYAMESSPAGVFYYGMTYTEFKH